MIHWSDIGMIRIIIEVGNYKKKPILFAEKKNLYFFLLNQL